MVMHSPWLYELARRPVPRKTEPGSLDAFVGVFDQARQYVVNVDYEAIRVDMVEKAQAGADFVIFLVEKAQAGADFVLSLDPNDVPPDVVVSLLMAFVVGILIVALLSYKKQQRMRHRELYGENAFPPYAPCTTIETVASLTGTRQPWFFKQCAERVGPVFRLRLPFTKAPMFVAVGDVETAKEILQDPETLKPQAMYSSITSIAGGPNIVSSEGIHWKLSRKGLSSAFMKTHLDRMHRVCKDLTEDWIERRLEPAIEAEESFDIGEECMLLTLSIICRTAFEYRIKENEALVLIKDLEAVSADYAVDEIQNPLRQVLGEVMPSVRKAAIARSRIQAFAKKVLTAHRKRHKDRRKTLVKSTTVVSCIDSNMNYENDEHRIADIVMVLLAGHDTTAYTLAWALLELARNPKELQDLRSALGGSNDVVAQEMLKDILREGMRLRPVSPGIGVRIIGKDFYLKDRAMVIPKGSHIMFPSMVLTRNGVENPEEFRPTRWAEHPDRTFLPFSTGKRNCLGQSLALAEVTWVLSRLCAKYDFEVVDEGKAEFCATMKCVGARLKARSRSVSTSE